jgi:hypothetical protein
MPALSAKLRTRLDRRFRGEHRAEALQLLETECDARLPLRDSMGEAELERIRCAVLKLSAGSLDKMRTAILAANEDWRDVLVAAGLGHRVRAHLKWLEQDEDA